MHLNTDIRLVHKLHTIINHKQRITKKRVTESTIPTVHKIRFRFLRRRRDIEHLLVRVRRRGGFNTNTRREIFFEEQIRDVATGYYGGLDGGDHGVEGVDVVKTLI